MGKCHPCHPPVPSCSPSARAGRGPADPGSAWWGRFTFNGITCCERGTYALVGGDELSDAERDQLLALCRQHLDAFREQRGEDVACLLIEKPAASATGAAIARRSAVR